MIYSNIDFSVVYVDPSAASGGDGTTPATALNALTTLSNDTCYIIRRTAESSSVTIPQTADVTDTLTHICFFGMPKSTDRLWEIVPEIARTAWGADTADYANLCAGFPTSVPPASYLTMDSLRFFMMHRCHLYRTGTNGYSHIFDSTNSSANGSFLIEHCRFGLNDAHLEDSTFTGVPTGYAVMFLNVAAARVFTMRDSIVYYYPGSSMYGGSGNAVYVKDVDYINLQNIQGYAVTRSYMSGGNYLFYISASKAMACYENLNFHILQRNDEGYIPGVFYAEKHWHCRMEKFTVDMPDRQLGSGTPTMRNVISTLVQCSEMREFKYKTIQISLPRCWYIGSGGHMLNLTGYFSSRVPGGQHEISDISIQLAETDGLDSQNNGLYYDSAKNSEYTTAAALVMDFGSSEDPGMEHVTANNITVNHPHGVALYACALQMQNVSIKGTAKFSRTQADVNTLASYYPGYALWAKAASTIRVRSLSVTKATAGYTGGVDDPAVGECNKSLIYVDSANAALKSNTCSTDDSGNQYGVICGSEIESGHFVHRTPNCVCDTCAVYRTGNEESESFKLWNNALDTTSDISLGRAPFLGVQMSPTALGKHKFICYAAVKGQADVTELATRFLVQLTVPQSDGTVKTFFSGIDGQWEPDTSSVWNNDTELSAYKLTIPIDVATTGAIDVKVHYNWYSSQGCVYLDPEFLLQQIP